VKHIVLLFALIMTTTLVHAGVMPEDLIPQSVEVTGEVVDQAVVSESTLQKKLNELLAFVIMAFIILL
jgi:hypothetical protein